MYRIVTLTRDDGTVIKTTTEELQTEKNWNKKFYKLRRKAVGELLRWRTGRGNNESRFYSNKEVLPMTALEKERYLSKQKLLRAEARTQKKEKKDAMRKADEKRFFEKFGVLTHEGSVIVIDTETTGLSSSDEILQLSIIDDDGEILFNEYFCPEYHCEWPKAEAIHGIRPSDVAEKAAISERMETIQGIVYSADIIVSYNAAFDLGMLKRHGVTIPENTLIIDMMILFAEVYGDYSDFHGDYTWKKLCQCADYYEYDWGEGNAHDALTDCRATLWCLQKMKDQLLSKLLRIGGEYHGEKEVV